MLIRKIVNGLATVEAASMNQIGEAHGNVSFPVVPTTADLLPFGYIVVDAAPLPAFDRRTHRVEEAPAVQVSGRWVQQWAVLPLSAEEVAERLADEKARLRSRVNYERDRRETEGFPYLGKTLDSDSVSVQRIAISVQAAQAAVSAGQPFGLDWTCADNSTLPLDAAAMIGVPVALAVYGNGLHQHARSLKAAIDAATTVAELDAIDILSGW